MYVGTVANNPGERIPLSVRVPRFHIPDSLCVLKRRQDVSSLVRTSFVAYTIAEFAGLNKRNTRWTTVVTRVCVCARVCARGRAWRWGVGWGSVPWECARRRGGRGGLWGGVGTGRRSWEVVGSRARLRFRDVVEGCCACLRVCACLCAGLRFARRWDAVRGSVPRGYARATATGG